MEKLYIAFGSNLGEREATIREALKMCIEQIGELEACSSFFETKPLNPPELENQPDYINGAAIFKTDLDPNQILTAIQAIEEKLGRDRANEVHWGPRTIDLDIVLLGDTVLKSERLTIPHPEMHKRDFVLEPLIEIDPGAKHPILNKTVLQLLNS